ncbi:uncharacterized protein LOC116225237 isoform X2 [Clupea harengus]|uniref:Uncharacterized protein LOC116225237 isoform X2 n=1 Tax=Clupea harengus TaxID=7950 RepID=A0A6P8GZ40_CLUHA|nr:uncharacterized protein LOC116225237 isoform X2 [Clupea harengus]
MEALCLILLCCFLIQCYGSTHFHYLKKGEEVTLSCETCQWEADVNSDNIVDCGVIDSIYTTNSKCKAQRQDLCQEIKKNKSTSCEICVMRGFFACVNAESDSCFMHPFKPSSHHVESFIVAQAEPDIVSGPVMENSVLVSGGESINLTCDLKTKGRSHTSKPSLDDNNIHNLKISKATQSDRGQYLCVLQVNTYSYNQHAWAVITNTTVIVGNPDSHLIYVIGALVPVLLLLPVIIIIIIILLKRKSAETKVSQTTITQRYQNGEGVDDDDCSPYAVSQGEQEPAYSFIQLTNQKTDPVFSGDGELTSDPSADEAITRMNSIYETSGP